MDIISVSNTLLTKYEKQIERVRKRTFGLQESLVGSDEWKFRRLMTNILVGGTTEICAMGATEELFDDETPPSKPERILKTLTDTGIKWPEKRTGNLIELLKQYPKTPTTREELEKLPGVGRHTASIFMALALNQNEFGVDTHVNRITRRLGFSQLTTSANVIEKLYTSQIKENLGSLSRAFVEFGQKICKFNPSCSGCPFAETCPSAIESKKMTYPDGVYEVLSSDGKKTYSIVVSNGFPHCGCKGFEYRGVCAHVKEQLPVLVRNW